MATKQVPNFSYTHPQAHIRQWLRGGYLHFQKSPSEYLCHPSIQFLCVFPLVPTLDFQLSHFDLVFFQKKRNPRLSKQTKVFRIIQDQQLNGSTNLLNKSRNEPWCIAVSKIREKWKLKKYCKTNNCKNVQRRQIVVDQLLGLEDFCTPSVTSVNKLWWSLWTPLKFSSYY